MHYADLHSYHPDIANQCKAWPYSIASLHSMMLGTLAPPKLYSALSCALRVDIARLQRQYLAEFVTNARRKSLCPYFQRSSTSWKPNAAEELLMYLLTVQGPSKGPFLSVEGFKDLSRSVFKDMKHSKRLSGNFLPFASFLLQLSQ